MKLLNFTTMNRKSIVSVLGLQTSLGEELSVNYHKCFTLLLYLGTERDGCATRHDSRQTIGSRGDNARPQQPYRHDEAITAATTRLQKVHGTGDPPGRGSGTAAVQRIDVPPGAHWRRRDRCRRRRRRSATHDLIPRTRWSLLSPLHSYT